MTPTLCKQLLIDDILVSYYLYKGWVLIHKGWFIFGMPYGFVIYPNTDKSIESDTYCASMRDATHYIDKELSYA